MIAEDTREQRRGGDVPPQSSSSLSSSSSSSAYANDVSGDRATPPQGTAPLSPSSSTSSANLARRAETSATVGGVWGPARSPTIRPPPDAALHPRGAHAAPPPSTSTASATPPPTALVMESLVRRYRVEEGRLLRWRLGGSKPVAPRSSIHAATAGGGRGAGGGPDVPRTSALGKGGAATSFAAAAAAAAGRSSTGDRLRANLAEAVQRSHIARAVQAWWRGREQLIMLTAKARRRRHPTTSTTPGVRFLDDSMVDGDGEAVGSAPAHYTASTEELSATSALSTWVSQAGRAFLRRFTPSLDVSSDGQHCVSLELHQRSAHRRAATAESSGDGGECREADEVEWSREGAADLQHQQQHREGAFPPSPLAAVGTAADDEVRTSPSLTSSSSSSSVSSRSSREGSRDAEAVREPHAVARSDTAVEEGSFTLSWVRGLRGGRPARAVADHADESFRSASRLLARSRARFGRWLRRQQRLQAARRSLHRVSEWHRSHRHSAKASSWGSSTGLLGHAEGAAAAAPLAGALPPSLRERAANAQPSPWEAPLPARQETPPDGTVEGPDSLPGPARQRKLLLAAIAAGTAAWQAQLRRSGSNEETAPAHDTRSVDGSSAAVPRAVQRARDDAAALTRLSGSLAALAQLEGRVSTVSTRGPDAEKVSGDVGERAAVGSAPSSSSSILVAAPCAAERHRTGAQDQHVCTSAEAPGEGSAFRSLLHEAGHARHDAAVRAVYEAVMGNVCGGLVQDDLDSAVGLRQSAADRALTQWVERQVLQELCNPSNSSSSSITEPHQPYQQHPKPVDCTGVLRHLRTGVPVSLSCLRLDEADHRALDSVRSFVRGDATAAVIGTAGFKISYAELASLRPGEWLNDQVINNYLELLRLEAGEEATSTSPQQRHAISAMSTHFYAKVEQELGVANVGVSDATAAAAGLPPLSAKSDVLRWLRRKQDTLKPYTVADPQAVRAVLVPVNIEAQHWALAVLYRADQRWVLYDSLSRSDAARRRGAAILARLAHAWREAQRHYGHLTDDTASVTATAEGTAASGVAGVSLETQPWVSACLVAAPCTRSASKGPTSSVSPLDCLAPYGSLDGLRRAEKRLRHHEDLLAEQAAVKATRGEEDGASAKTAAASSQRMLQANSPAGQWTDAEVSWFTGGFDRAPQQANGYDCGVFVCQAAWCVAQGVAVDFTQADVSLLRSVITLELLSKKLLRRYPTAYTAGSAGV